MTGLRVYGMALSLWAVKNIVKDFYFLLLYLFYSLFNSSSTSS